jgi:hypothetical protein
VKSVFIFASFIISPLFISPYAIANFQTEISTAMALQEFDEFDDVKFYGLNFTRFDKALLIKGPLAETVYLNKKSSWFVTSYDTDQNTKLETIIGRTQFINANTYIAIDTNFISGNNFSDLTLSSGHYLDDKLLMSASTSFTRGRGWDEYVLFSARKLFSLDNNHQVAIEYSSAIEDEKFLEYQAMDLSYYPVNFFSLSMNISHDKKAKEGTYISFEAQYFFNMQTELSFGYGKSNQKGVGNTWLISGSYRF